MNVLKFGETGEFLAKMNMGTISIRIMWRSLGLSLQHFQRYLFALSWYFEIHTSSDRYYYAYWRCY